MNTLGVCYKKALLAVAVLAASSSAFAATATDKHKVVIIGQVFGETCVIESGESIAVPLMPISQSQVKEKADASGPQEESKFGITLDKCSVNHVKTVGLKFDTKITSEGYLQNVSAASNSAKGVALALYESEKEGGNYEFLNLSNSLSSKKQVNVPKDNSKVTFYYGVDYVKAGGVDVQPGPVASVLKYDIEYK